VVTNGGKHISEAGNLSTNIPGVMLFFILIEGQVVMAKMRSRTTIINPSVREAKIEGSTERIKEVR
jgi:hypothetical protein